MKRILLFFAMLPLLFTSCTKDSLIDIDKEDSVYYVKYTANTTDRDLGVISFKNEEGKMVQVGNDGRNRNNFEIIIGPVSCGFKCLITVSNHYSQTKIECSKNHSPFAYKVSAKNEVTYLINY